MIKRISIETHGECWGADDLIGKAWDGQSCPIVIAHGVIVYVSNIFLHEHAPQVIDA
jgi:hypothetical protein